MQKEIKKYKKGFTLIEALIYLALFGILMGGAIVAAYNIYESGSRISARIIVLEEGNFLLAKINWALSGISAVNFPLVGSTGSKLLVTTVDSAIGSISIESGGTDIVMTQGGVTQTLNNTNVTVDNLLFDYKQNGNVEWITSSFTLNTRTADGKPLSQNFKGTKYLRK